SVDWNDGKSVLQLWGVPTLTSRTSGIQLTGRASDVAFGRNGSELFVALNKGPKDAYLMRYAASNALTLQDQVPLATASNAIAISPSGATLAVGGADVKDHGFRSGSVAIMRTADLKVIGHLQQKTEISSLAFLDEATLAVGGGSYFGKNGY